MFEMSILELYWIPLLASCLYALKLNFVGFYLMPLKRTFEIVMVAQAATFFMVTSQLLPIGSFGGSIISIVATLLFWFLFIRSGVHSDQLYIAAYFALLAATYWVISFFPQLESHMALGLFGDIVTMSNQQAWIAGTLSIPLLGILLFQRKRFTRELFERVVLDEGKERSFMDVLFYLIVLSSLAFFGLLFTMGFLLIFPALAFRRSGSFYSGIVLGSVVSVISCISGVLFSLSFERVPVVPSQLIGLTLISIATIQLTRMNNRKCPDSNDLKRGLVRKCEN